MAARKSDAPKTTEAPQYDGRHNIAITADDVALPRMRIVQTSGDHFKARRFEEGDIVIGTSSDDVGAVKVGGEDEGVIFHVLDMVKKKSGEDEAGNYRSWNLGDPETPAGAKDSYEFTLCIPEFDTMMPVLYTFGGSSARIGEGINSALARHQQTAAPYELAFKMTTQKKQRDRNSWAAPVVLAQPANQASIEVAASMADQLAGPAQQMIESETDSF